MASLDGASPHDDFSVNAMTFSELTTPPTYQTIYPLLYTPLALPRDGPDGYLSPSAYPFCDSYDFQSNHLENARQVLDTTPSPLSGLGIRNLEFSKDKETQAQDNRIFRTDSWLGHQPHERRSTHRNYRTGSIYDMPEEHTDDLPDSLGPPWAFSAILEAAELVTEHPSSEMNGSILNLGEPSDHFSSNCAQDVNWAFEKISASTGMSVADFAAQVSATAEETLRRMSGDKFMTESISLEPEQYRRHEEYNDVNHTWLPPLAHFSPAGLRLSDINSRDLSWSSDCAGVNPADTYSVLVPSNPVTQRVFIGHPSQIASTLECRIKPTLEDDQSKTPDPETNSQPTLGSPFEESSTLPQVEVSPYDAPQGSDDEPSVFQSPSSSEYSPVAQPLSLKRNASSRISTRRTTRKTEDSDITFNEYQDGDHHNHLPVNLGTPVFDAHRGIGIEELKAKAERYRLRNQGRDYDKRWLISFAGKLSAKGELVEEFRCYVSGCKQNNKRRDHILIHVGAHLDQRPFKCVHCSSRFLRKNECKRHELSHTGIRPFACNLCPSPTTTFVRQDLLKRHMKRTHHIDFKADKENEDGNRPKKRARH